MDCYGCDSELVSFDGMTLNCGDDEYPLCWACVALIDEEEGEGQSFVFDPGRSFAFDPDGRGKLDLGITRDERFRIPDLRPNFEEAANAIKNFSESFGEWKWEDPT